MNKVKTIALALTALAATVSGQAAAQQFYSYTNVSVNYLDWSDGTSDRSNWEDYAYLQLEAGAGYDWGDLYGFMDIENPGKGEWMYESDDDKAEAFRVALKGTVAVNIGESHFNYYASIYSRSDSSFSYPVSTSYYEQNLVLGVSYDYHTDFGLWVKPYVGAHYIHNSMFGAGFNGGMAGWVLGYNFQLGGQKFMITNWNDIEFARADEARGYTAFNEETHLPEYHKTNGDSSGINGSVAFWWNATPDLTVGVQYRYANQMLGNATYQNGTVFSAKYNF
ncbi:outer membrane protein OmpK [Shewanella youngdeokensis]|uniref:Outer membrane protein OmpK n=1 Tax=Shewanella youngdeokensis TaxID=2999068 RepID=A0ABZ0K0D4_9GAMM|nr:outer membrane protein OmpK [Shewanella sp. DAU334]